ncbi:benzoate/H(+) symporter BenE family transporter [Marinomonas mediterranea]|jgi:benzoate transporter|uniref:Benzoate transporter n=1 Tax=Marinomonas mediterranea (strain ATCC 700492 / JCM 21426 / NBRC 103028 / MMB-1) TaxID=717774 RepID=F2JYV5_MARM1|nr:benzoate/H(+) symporter BenE family transporter [Marinomonas mediterranea]ADZ90820.1 benzoate transporter [Marinomonas mediterranea MMB-1]WCN16973.1 benzoate/H(+) symporter BenE family transporter [Marinomonas mediterranea MMB-1]
MLKDLHISTITAGLVAVLVSYSGPLAIFFQAANSANISQEMMTSWVFAISIGAAISGIALSIYFRIPIITAWSAPGTALLVTLFPNLSLNEAVGAYITAAIIIFCIGISGWFDAVIRWIPKSVAAAMMAGILFNFGISAFQAFNSVPVLTFLMLIGFVVFKAISKTYCLILLVVLCSILSITVLHADFSHFTWQLASPIWISPQWSWSSTFSLALPLVIVSLTGQFLPGFTILKTFNYHVPTRPVISVLGLVSLPIAFFGGITTVIAAITAPICTSPDAHPDHNKRYIAGIFNGVFYLIGGIFAGSIVLFFTTFPAQMIAIIAGLALLGAIFNSLSLALEDKSNIDAATITFMTTASGIQLLGIGSAFWGVVLGTGVYTLIRAMRTQKARQEL